jgi:hypothetical protein
MLGGELLDRERNRRVVETNGHVDALTFEPASRDGDADVGLVLVIGKHDLDGLAKHGAAGILGRQSCRGHRARATEIGVQPRLVVEDADLHDVVGDLGEYWGRQDKKVCSSQREQLGEHQAECRLPSHGAPPDLVFAIRDETSA